jgi:hypothetical protein
MLLFVLWGTYTRDHLLFTPLHVLVSIIKNMWIHNLLVANNSSEKY